MPAWGGRYPSWSPLANCMIIRPHHWRPAEGSHERLVPKFQCMVCKDVLSLSMEGNATFNNGLLQCSTKRAGRHRGSGVERSGSATPAEFRLGNGLRGAGTNESGSSDPDPFLRTNSSSLCNSSNSMVALKRHSSSRRVELKPSACSANAAICLLRCSINRSSVDSLLQPTNLILKLFCMSGRERYPHKHIHP
jgi:hypothetical protein